MTKNFEAQGIFVTKERKILLQKNVEPKIFWIQKDFGPGTFWFGKSLGSKKFWSKSYCVAEMSDLRIKLNKKKLDLLQENFQSKNF